MDKHKKLALENNCKCEECSQRFSCFTQERIFTDPVLQGLYEALLSMGKTKEQALDEVTRELKNRIPYQQPWATGTITVQPQPYYDPSSSVAPYIPPSYTISNSAGYSDNVTFTVPADGKTYITYTCATGEKIGWFADENSLRVCDNQVRTTANSSGC